MPSFLVPRMALGGVTQPLVLDQMRGNAAPVIDYDRLAEANARALRRNPPVTRWADFKAAEGRAGFTDSLANS
ncbi:MAG: hypothetical protein ACRYG7_10240 [Janthinobacterium lividum]